MWFDLILLGILAGVTWAVGSQGMWGAALMLLNVLFAGLLAMNLFEPAANLMASIFGQGGNYWYDLLSIMLIFSIALFVLRMITDNISPLLVRFSLPLDQAGRWLLALWTGWLTIGILATAVHTAPLPRDFIGFTPEREKFLGMNWPRRPDRVWLAYTQRCSEKLLDRSSDGRYRFDVWPGEQWRERTSQGEPPTSTEAARLFIARYATRRAAAAGGSAAPTESTPRQGTGGPLVF